MADETKTPREEDDAGAGRQGRVSEAFKAFHQALPNPLPDPARDSLEKLREAVAAKDAARVREHLQDVKEKHGWLYTRLAEHPEIAAMINEMAIWGF